MEKCPYCHSTDIVKSGLRKKKFEEIQVFLCRHCQKKFTPLITKNRQHPVAVILQSMILYNRFKSGEEIVDFFQKSLGHKVSLKTNRACEMAKFVTQAVANNKERHQRLQEFMFFCDSVTIATEVPVLLDQADLDHYKHVLNFKIPIELKNENDIITGHIDIVQLRNGMIHILDYKPSAHKEKPVEQLTLYALALSRLTSLRLYNFKCAWFDEDNYYEFYPLHVVYKKKKKIANLY